MFYSPAPMGTFRRRRGPGRAGAVTVQDAAGEEGINVADASLDAPRAVSGGRRGLLIDEPGEVAGP